MADEQETTDRFPGALGDPRAMYSNTAGAEKIDDWFDKEARRQLELRAMIPPGGRRKLYLDHLHALAVETGAVLTLYHPRGFIANWRAETALGSHLGRPDHITTPLPLTRQHYLTGLHEFGHVHQPSLGGTSNHDATVEGIYGELMADVWAFEHSLVPVAEADVRDAEDRVLAVAADAGWKAGPVEDFLPPGLRSDYRAAMQRLRSHGK